MNVFKNFIRLATFVAILFTVACTKEDVSVSETLADGTATVVDELVVSGTGGGGGGDSTTADSTRHRCWKGGKHGEHPGRVKGDSIAFSALPAAAQTYLNANTDVSTITRIVKITLKDSTVNYSVRFSTGIHIHFDATGAVITKPTNNHVFTEITLTDLPAAAQTYLSSNTTVANISTIVKITKPDGTIVYGVRMTDNTFYAFDSAGALLATGTKRGKGKKH